ncbi:MULTISPECIES: helix-turn-helix transcriptional regulator [Blastomonas]|uniref:helix-turn-helix transcriptional regulator n=1 Tax=Blastomonas TaxID=150203 RepID=UPI0025A3A199|nr:MULTISPECIES: helix-turn-helix transcriptional regulator [Blastomonas]MDM7954806.1 helix-turn-helix transcriptional regulator [Blastomonas sp.]MDM7965067.1 helix-turn-helix transcriptional regulator [Blastomonas fulva]
MRVDTGLLEALHEGMFQTPLWDGFLQRLRASAGAGFALLAIRPQGQSVVAELVAGDGPVAPVRRLLARANLREGRGYALDELLDLAEPDARAEVREALHAARLTALRAIRVTEPSGVDGWLAVAGDRALGSSAGALLLGLAPHLRIALRSFAALERERFRSAVTGEAFNRLNIAWMTLDAQGRIVESTQSMEQMFQWGSLLRRGRYDRLVPASPAIDRQLTGYIKQVATGTTVRPLAINLSQDPWFDMLVAPLQGDTISGHRSATVIVYVSGDRRSQADRCEQLVDLFGLLPSEARLAWLLAQATSISEAADTLGITVETARNYSKKIYAKTGARGHAELVRVIMTSVLALS